MEKNIIIIQTNKKTFVITNTPTDSTLTSYFDLYKSRNITTIVRTCEPLYSSSRFENLGMKVVDLFIEDGNCPDLTILEKWLNIVKEEDNIAVHCVAGLGRSPLLVCIALIEFEGLSPIDAIDMIRKQNPNTFNSKQIDYLIRFKKTEKNSYSCLIS